ncbi:hypothetical protein [Mycobacterium intracellulare]|uniref:hypothetical protein n=1 Tax=Mycobacterium intracellulare TaxID=1767 RepID=UPI0011AB758C|nr:hypothetical protein [Mycobacterium intracellulare]
MIIHGRHDQLRARRRTTHPRGRSTHRAGLIPNQPRPGAALRTNLTTLGYRLPRVPVKTIRTGLRLLIRPTGGPSPTRQTAVAIRGLRHRHPTPSGEHLPTTRPPAGNNS